MTKRDKTTEYSWDDYVDEAAVEPFRLRVSADELIEIHPPNANALVHIHRGWRSGDLELVVTYLTGDAWPRIRELFGEPSASHKVLPKIIEDLMDHFDIYEEVSLRGPGGGIVKRKRPRDVKALIEQGYRPAGEAAASSA